MQDGRPSCILTTPGKPSAPTVETQRAGSPFRASSLSGAQVPGSSLHCAAPGQAGEQQVDPTSCSAPPQHCVHSLPASRRRPLTAMRCAWSGRRVDSFMRAVRAYSRPTGSVVPAVATPSSICTTSPVLTDRAASPSLRPLPDSRSSPNSPEKQRQPHQVRTQPWTPSLSGGGTHLPVGQSCSASKLVHDVCPALMPSKHQ